MLNNVDEALSSDDEDDIPCLVSVPDVVVEQTTPSSASVPITLLTGYLGSGKTTLLNYILRSDHGKRIAVIENEFSAGLGIEGVIAKNGLDGNAMEGFFELNNGCICCSMKGDLIVTLEKLLTHSAKFDYVLIEATGVANPGDIISVFWLDDTLGNKVHLDGVVTLVDAVHIHSYLESPDLEQDVKAQIAFADRILLNKCDIASAEQKGTARKFIREMNTFADIVDCVYSKVPGFLDVLLDIHSYSNEKVLSVFDSFSSSSSSENYCAPCVPPASGAAKAAKLSPPLTAPLAAHTPRSSLTTESFVFPGMLDMHLMNRWLDKILYSERVLDPVSEGVETRSMVLYRVKGLLHFPTTSATMTTTVDTKESTSTLHILQAVHETFAIEVYTPPTASGQTAEADPTNGMNKLIIIGRYLNRDKLWEGCEACMLPTQP